MAVLQKDVFLYLLEDGQRLQVSLTSYAGTKSWRAGVVEKIVWLVVDGEETWFRASQGDN